MDGEEGVGWELLSKLLLFPQLSGVRLLSSRVIAQLLESSLLFQIFFLHQPFHCLHGFLVLILRLSLGLKHCFVRVISVAGGRQEHRRKF